MYIKRTILVLQSLLPQTVSIGSLGIGVNLLDDCPQANRGTGGKIDDVGRNCTFLIIIE